MTRVLAALLALSLIACGALGFLWQRAEKRVNIEASSHSQTKASVAIASAQATGLVLSNIIRVNSEQEKVNEERLASLRGRLANAERLRAESEAAARRAGKAPVSGLPASTGGTPATTQSPAGLDVETLSALIRYDELISWVEQMHLIPTSPSE